MVGDGEATILTGDMERQLDAAYRTIALKRSQSIGGWLMTKIADMSVFTRSEGFESESSGKGGILSRVTGFLRS